MIPLDACKECRNDFYNGRTNLDGTDRCWSAKTGTIMTRYRIHYMTAPTVRGAYTEVTAPSCYHQSGNYVFHDKLPDFVKAEDLNRENR